MTDFRALCVELVEAWDSYSYADAGDAADRMAEAVKAARAALAADQMGEGPPAVTISALLHPAYEPGDGSADGAQMVGLAWWHPAMGCDSLQIVVDNARNILRSRWGRPAANAITCDDWLAVAMIAQDMRSRGVAEQACGDELLKLANSNRSQPARTAELLQRRHPEPVPVSERLPVDVEQALIKAECALSDIAEGEPEENGDSDDLLQWAEQRAATALSRIRPVMRGHGILTSEWPPLPATTLPLSAEEGES